MQRCRFAAVPVRGMLCFVEADWPLLEGAFTVSGIDVLPPRKAVDKITARGQITLETTAQMHAHLAYAFPMA
jgi:hypothetical protein